MTELHAGGAVFLAIPAQAWMWTESAAAISILATVLPPGSCGAWECSSSSIARNRNVLTRTFLEKTSCEWLLFMDSDMKPAPDLSRRLVASGKSFIGATYVRRQPPFEHEFRSLHPEEPDPPSGIREVEHIGFGSVLIRRNVILDIPEPWFEHPAPGINEDFYFCEKVRAAGHRIWVDLNTEVGHVGVTAITPEFSTFWERRPLDGTSSRGPRREVQAYATTAKGRNG